MTYWRKYWPTLMPITAYIRIRKLQYAIVSLLEGHKVLDVAFMYAFESHEGFTRAFTQLFGSTPSTARKHLTSYTVPEYVVPMISSKRFKNMETIKLRDLQYNMHQLVFEFLEQSLEEAKAGYCNKIEVVLLSGGMVKISDSVHTSGTEIIFKPDTAIFGNTAFSQEMLWDWIKKKIGDIANLKVHVHSMDIE